MHVVGHYINIMHLKMFKESNFSLKDAIIKMYKESIFNLIDL